MIRGGGIAQWCDLMGVKYVVTDQKAKELRELYGEKVIEIEQLIKEYSDANIIVSSIVYCEEITQDLLKLGVAKGRIYNCFIFMPENVDWSIIESNDKADWELMSERIEMIANRGWIPDTVSSVADYGCGHRFLEKYIPENAIYYPIDYVDRGEKTIICDFNKFEYPEIKSQISTCLGVAIYIKPMEKLVEHICKFTEETIIFSFITLEGHPNIEARRKSGICQDYTDKQILDMFHTFQYELEDRVNAVNGNCTMTFYLFQRKGIHS